MDPVVETPIKKKRGRKPKDAKVDLAATQTVNILDSFASQSNAVRVDDNVKVVDEPSSKVDIVSEVATAKTVDTTVDDSAPKKGKRGRKPKYVYTSFESTTHEEPHPICSLSDDENVIVRLNIAEPIIEDINNQEEQPYAYNHDTYSNISNINDLPQTSTEIIHEKKNKYIGSKVVNILQDFEEKNKNNEWPLNTSISCYWCCHRFENAPVGIPINYIRDKFDVFGCFCSLDCAAAYNFSENTNQDEMWERYHLINLLSRKMKLGNLVKAAPSRLSLKIFGGHMEIDAFRGFSKVSKFINVNFPPMASITQQLEEINDFEIGNDFKYIPVDNERINKYKEKIVFKRSKPLIDTNKSLESTMNLKIKDNSY